MKANYSPGALKIKKVWDHFISERIVNHKIQNLNLDSYLANVFCPGPFYYYVIDFTDRSLPFISNEVLNVLGWKLEDYSLEKFFEILHPDDAEFMAACEHKIGDFLFNKLTSEQRLKYKFTYQFRLKDALGKFRHILHQAIALSIDQNGELYQVLGIHTDIGHITTNVERHISFIGLQGEPSYLGIDPTKEHYLNHHEKDLFTAQEKKVIALMAEGLNTASVADLLKISKATAATHRKNILKKSGCKNMIEVVAKAIRKSII